MISIVVALLKRLCLTISFFKQFSNLTFLIKNYNLICFVLTYYDVIFPVKIILESGLIKHIKLILRKKVYKVIDTKTAYISSVNISEYSKLLFKIIKKYRITNILTLKNKKLLNTSYTGY